MRTTAALKATALVAAAVVLALLTVQGTLALWSKVAASPAQTVQGADFSVLVTPANGAAQRLSGTGPVALPATAGLKPGDSRTTALTVTNDTNASGAFKVEVTAGALSVTGSVLVPHLTTSLRLGQNGSCTSPRALAPMVLDKGASGTLCLTVALAATAPATAGGSAASVSLNLSAVQQP